MSASSWKETASQLAANLEGIGAALNEDEGIVVTSVVPGGPADKDGRLKPGDRIVGVLDNIGGMIEFVNTTLRQAVSTIRGPAGTKVKLVVVPRGETKRAVYEITRSKILTTDALMQARILEQGTKSNGQPCKVGYIELPSLYQDNAPGGHSATNDVWQKLKEFSERGVDVVLLDLRRNGGGYFSESISLTGLFINKGPVLQLKDKDANVTHNDDVSEGVAWNKPLVVLTSRQTASGCEIFCGAIQDYNRGLIVGDDSTFGLGTLQRLYDVSEELFKVPNRPDLGKLRLTNAQFYRPNGDSTQNRGIYADLILPSLTGARTQTDQRNSTAIGFDRVAPIAHEAYGMVNTRMLEMIRDRSIARRRISPDFENLTKRLEREQNRVQRLFIPLNEQKYVEQQKQFEFPSQLRGKPGERDFYLNEVLSVSVDYVNLFASEQLAQGAPGGNVSSNTRTPVQGATAEQMAKHKEIESKTIEVERNIEKDGGEVAKCELEVKRWDDSIRDSDKVMERAETNGQQLLVGFGASFAHGKRAEAERNLKAAKSSLEADRARLGQLREELKRLMK